MAEKRAMTRNHLPDLGTEEEVRAFWDSHSPEDFPGEFTEAKVEFDHPLVKRGLTVKLSEETISKLRELATAQGIGPSTLARMWILERLNGQPTRTKNSCE